MTTLYKPVLIESAEQAEALSIGTTSIAVDEQGQPYQASIRVRGGWHCTGEAATDGSTWLAPHDVMIGDTALVPIEAEEERLDPTDPARRRGAIPSTRLVTAWEEA